MTRCGDFLEFSRKRIEGGFTNFSLVKFLEMTSGCNDIIIRK